ncbi:lysosomal dipeptide transporter MFSD1-like isoform 5-T5 [Pangshura tecta]
MCIYKSPKNGTNFVNMSIFCNIDNNMFVHSTAYYRFLVLFFNCLLTFGSYFCFDIPSVLQEQFQGNLTCPNGTQHNGTGHNGTLACVEGLGMTPAQYNLLYAIYAWTNALVVILAGFLIDKLGNHVGVFLFSFLTVLGSSIFALGSHFKGTQYLLPLMLMGRLLFGSGNGSLTNIQESLILIPSGPPSMNWEIAPVVQNRITAFWFKGKELALAFGLTLSFSRLGSVLNFFFTQQFETHFGIQWTLWGASSGCPATATSLLAPSPNHHVLLQWGLPFCGRCQPLSFRAEKSSTPQGDHQGKQDLLFLEFPRCMPPPQCPQTFRPSLSIIKGKFIQDKYSGYSQQAAAYIAGAVYDSSLVLSAAVGILIASLWPSIPLVVPQATLGTAMGLATSVQMIGIGLSNLIVGHILGTKSSELKIPLWRWQQMMIFMLANTIACITASVSLNVVDKQQGGTLNRATKRSSAEQVRQPVGTTPLLDEVGDEELIN